MRKLVLLVLCAYVSSFAVIRKTDAAFSESTPSNSIFSNGLLKSIFLPNPDFELGLSRSDIETIAHERYAGWSMEQDETRTDHLVPIMPDKAKDPYVVSLMLADRTERRVYNRNYSFSFTSPLSGNEAYSIVFDIKTREKNTGLLSMQEWIGKLMAQWGPPHWFTPKSDMFSVSYFFGPDGMPMPPAALPHCRWVSQDFFRLEQKIPEKVAEIAKLVDQTGCFYRLENVVYLNAEGNISRSVATFTDYRRRVQDVSKRRQPGVD